MKFILLLTFVALCYSYPYQYGNSGRRNVSINGDGTIVVTGEDGKTVTITRNNGVAGKRIDIAVSGPNIPTKRIQIDEQKELRDVNLLDENDEDYQRDKRSSRDARKRSSQGDTLAEILREYQGGVDEPSYQQLLKKVNAAVQTGQLSRSIYEVLQGLTQGSVGQNQGPWTPQQQDILRQQIQNQGVTGSSLTKPYNVLDLLRRQVIQQQLQELQQQQGYQTQGRYRQQYQQGGYYGVPVSQQQILSPYGQTYETPEGRVIGASVKEIVLEVPTVGGKQEIIEGILLEDPQVVTYQNGQGGSYGFEGLQGTTPSGVSSYDLLNSIYGTQGLQQRGVSWGQYGQRMGRYGQGMGQYGQQAGQYSPYGQYGQRVGPYGEQIGQYGQQVGQFGQQWGQIGQRIPAELSEIIEDEREIIGQQRQNQQQQLQQEQQQQILQQSLLQQRQQQQQQQQVQQQLLQQIQQQQLQQQGNTWRQYLLNGGSIQGGAQQGELLQQQLGVYPQGGLYGGYVQQGQGTPYIQRYNVPLIL